LSWLVEIQRHNVDRVEFENDSLIEIQSCSDVPKSLALFEILMAFENFPFSARHEFSSSDDLGFEICAATGFDQGSYPVVITVWRGGGMEVGLDVFCLRVASGVAGGVVGLFAALLCASPAHPGATIEEILRTGLAAAAGLMDLGEEAPEAPPLLAHPRQD